MDVLDERDSDGSAGGGDECGGGPGGVNVYGAGLCVTVSDGTSRATARATASPSSVSIRDVVPFAFSSANTCSSVA